MIGAHTRTTRRAAVAEAKAITDSIAALKQAMAAGHDSEAAKAAAIACFRTLNPHTNEPQMRAQLARASASERLLGRRRFSDRLSA
jgi:hypothetical protein